MAQSSGPISQGTDAERQFTDVMWRHLLGDEAGVFGDHTGDAYALTRPVDNDIATVGSSIGDSTARVAGFFHNIPMGQPEPIEIPAASGAARTDIIALRYDPTYSGLPGPVRLVRIAGTTSATPSYDPYKPGIEELPLWKVTRSPGQSLSQATVVKMYPRIAPALSLDSTSADLPTGSPIGSVLYRGTQEYRRVLDGNGNAIWQLQATPFASSATNPVNLTIGSGFENWGFGYLNLCYWREEQTGHVAGTVRLLSNMSAASAPRTIATVPSGFRPSATVPSSGITTYARTQILSNGQIQFDNDTYGVTLQAGTLIAVQLTYPLA